MEGEDECESSTDDNDEQADLDSGLTKGADMLTLNQPPLTQHVSVPKDMSNLSVEAYTAGVVEGVLDGLDLVCLCFSWFGEDESALC